MGLTGLAILRFTQLALWDQRNRQQGGWGACKIRFTIARLRATRPEVARPTRDRSAGCRFAGDGRAGQVAPKSSLEASSRMRQGQTWKGQRSRDSAEYGAMLMMKMSTYFSSNQTHTHTTHRIAPGRTVDPRHAASASNVIGPSGTESDETISFLLVRAHDTIPLEILGFRDIKRRAFLILESISFCTKFFYARLSDNRPSTIISFSNHLLLSSTSNSDDRWVVSNTVIAHSGVLYLLYRHYLTNESKIREEKEIGAPSFFLVYRRQAWLRALSGSITTTTTHPCARGGRFCWGKRVASYILATIGS